ncbi:MAG: ABC transporter substrate-binding protein [Chloroflexi bacterium]|nr:ABC transporter substrate-binding protein [Chloroflexota bacterium]
MEKKRVICLIALVATALLAGCTAAATPTPTAKPAPAATSPAKPTPAPSKQEGSSAASPTAAKPAATPVAPTPVPAAIKIGSLQSISDAGVYIAIEKGYFKEQGITVSLENFLATPDIVLPLTTGQIDVGMIPLSVGMLAAADRGIELKMVADKGSSRQGFELAWIILRKDLYDSGQVKTPADLKGMKLGVASPGSISDQALRLAIAEGGLTDKDVDLATLPFADHGAAMSNKAIAAAVTIEPFIANAVAQGFAVKWIPLSRYFDGKLTNSGIWFGAGLLKNRELGERFTYAYLKGARDYMKAFTARVGRDEAINALMKYTRVKDPKLYDVMDMPYIDPDGLVDIKSLEAQYNWYREMGLYKGSKIMKDLLDPSFAENTVKKLGKN